jgi:hypothetical protein
MASRKRWQRRINSSSVANAFVHVLQLLYCLQVVIVGESHNDPGAHLFEFALLRKMLTAGPPAGPPASNTSQLSQPSSGRISWAKGHRCLPNLYPWQVSTSHSLPYLPSYAMCAAGNSTNMWTILHTDPHLITPQNDSAPKKATLKEAISSTSKPETSPCRPVSTPPYPQHSASSSFTMLSSGPPCMLSAAAAAPSLAGGTNLSSAAANAAAADAVKPLIQSAFLTMSRSFSSLCGLSTSSHATTHDSTRSPVVDHTAPASVTSDDESMDGLCNADLLHSPRDTLSQTYHGHRLRRPASHDSLPTHDTASHVPKTASHLTYTSLWFWNARETSAGNKSDIILHPRAKSTSPTQPETSTSTGPALAARATAPSPLSHLHTASAVMAEPAQLQQALPATGRPPPHPPALPRNKGTATAASLEGPATADLHQSVSSTSVVTTSPSCTCSASPPVATSSSQASMPTQLAAPVDMSLSGGLQQMWAGLSTLADEAISGSLESIRRPTQTDMARRKDVALSLEMFEGDVQRVVSEYLAGHIAEEDFVEV